jgi:hypothetical protein
MLPILRVCEGKVLRVVPLMRVVRVVRVFF